MRLRRDSDIRFTIPRQGLMRVPGVVYASESLLPDDDGDTLAQVANTATLPGVVQAAYAMPDLHLGYGFPIGGVAATAIDDGGVVSPGGVGFDISCGVRLLAAPLAREDIDGDAFATLMAALDRTIPRGTGPGGLWELDGRAALLRVLVDGSAAAVEAGYGTEQDLERTEDRGRLEEADAEQVSDKAVRRGLQQVGSLGGGNHFLEIQVVDDIVDDHTAGVFGLERDQITVAIHCGSRGLGHQVCTDHVRAMQAAMNRYSISVPDRQLACAPVESPEGQAYFGGMAASANYGRANRQVLAEAARNAFEQAFGTRALELVYDVSHNMAKIERHDVNGRERRLCVHRKGATLALPPRHPDLAADFRDTGQPVFVPGSMGTASWLLAGTGREAFSSTCHGAGRAKSRSGARKEVRGQTLKQELEEAGIAIRALSDPGLAEEAPSAYKDVDEVVRVCEGAGLSRRVARLRPLGVVKG